MFKLPPMPTPPVTTNAPLVVPLDACELVSVVRSLAVSVVNAPVAAVLAPMAKLSA